MGHDEEARISQSVVSLHEHLEGKIDDLSERIEMQFNLNQTAIDKAEVRMEIRLEGMNEIREQLSRQSATFVTREMMDQRLGSIGSEVASLKETRVGLAAKASAGSVWLAYLLSFLGVAMGLYELAMRK